MAATVVAPTKWVGSSVKRNEDPRLLTGHGHYVDDIRPANLHHLAIVRSPYGHARIRGIDTTRAEKAPGVRAVITGTDVAAMCHPFQVGVSASIKYYALAVDKARWCGEPVAAVVARTRYEAEDACDLIEVDYEPLPAVVDPEEAMADGAPMLHDGAPSNVAMFRQLNYGDVDQAFAQAKHIVKTDRLNFPKYTSAPMETYGVIAEHDASTGEITIWSNFHGPFIMHPITANSLKMDANKLRFIVPGDIGGSFGIKSSVYPYMALTAVAAQKVDVPVKWTEDRREHLIGSSSGTDRVHYMEAAVDDKGVILGLKARLMDNVGGYIRSPEPACTVNAVGNFVGAYKLRNLRMDMYCVMTNKCPTGPNRGYGRQQLYFGLERLVDKIAEQLQLDPAEVRMRNFIPADAFPYTTPTGGIYDSGNYQAAMRKLLEIANYDELKKRRDEARRQGKLFGIGIATAVDSSVSNISYVTVAIDPKIRARADYLPKSGATESVTILVDPLGKATALINTMPQGQGHETAVAQIVADELGVTPAEVHVISEFDTYARVWHITSGTYSSRFSSIGASAAKGAAQKIREKLVKIAAHMMEAAEEDIDVRDGRFFVRGTDRSMSIKHVAGTAHWNPLGLPKGMEAGLQATHVYTFDVAKPPDEQDRINSLCTYGFIAELVAVEIDPETWKVTILSYNSCSDAGNIINPMLVEGQMYGAVTHGMGAALFEELAYDADGQMLTASFMDYLCPTASEGLELNLAHVVTPSPITLLGSKGMGEASCMTAPAMIANAVEDALRPLGIRIDRLPVSPDRLWRLASNNHPSL